MAARPIPIGEGVIITVGKVFLAGEKLSTEGKYFLFNTPLPPGNQIAVPRMPFSVQTGEFWPNQY